MNINDMMLGAFGNDAVDAGAIVTESNAHLQGVSGEVDAITRALFVDPTAPVTGQPTADGQTASIETNATNTPTVAQPLYTTGTPVDGQVNTRLLDAEREAAYYRGMLEASQAASPTHPAPTAAPSRPAYSPDNDALTPQELAAYGDSVPVIEKIARKLAHRAIGETEQRIQQYEQQIQNLSQQLAAVQSNTDRAASATFLDRVRAQVPDMDSIVRSPAWTQGYLNSPAPFHGGATVGEALRRAVDSHNDRTVVEFLATFKAFQKGADKKVETPSIGRTAQVAPVGLAMPQARRAVSDSALDQLTVKVQNGTVSRDEYDRILGEVLGAAASGAELVQ